MWKTFYEDYLELKHYMNDIVYMNGMTKTITPTSGLVTNFSDEN